MSTSTASALLRYAAELRSSIRHAWEMERHYPDRAPYYRARRKIALERAREVLQWAREEMIAPDKSIRTVLHEFDMENRRRMTAYREAAE